MMHDTDTLVALVASLLPEKFTQSPANILDALISCNGDVQVAVDQILKLQVASKETRRKRPAVLSDWLYRPSNKKTRACDGTPNVVSGNSNVVDSDDRTEASSISFKSQSRDEPSESKSKPPINLHTILRQPPTQAPTIPRLPPLTLTTPTLVASHVPCTLHCSVLPPELACRLFYEMLDASAGWERNKWWLFDRIVESPHKTFFFARDDHAAAAGFSEAAQYWYNGRATLPPPSFSPAMEEACAIIEQTVNKELSKRTRYRMEYPGSTWRANVAAANRYEGTKEGVGPHSDQLTYLGPYPTIASLSLGTQRTFRLREVVPLEEADHRHPRTFNIPLPHNSLIIMHASCQERFKHSVPPQSTLDLFHPPFPRSSKTEPSNVRINLTFRFYRPDFHPSTTPKCHCGVPTILRHDMKRRDGRDDRYWWVCYAGAQRDGKGCKFWKEMDMVKEGRGGTSKEKENTSLVL